MPASLRTCADCSTAYALDLSVCPHCGSSDFVDEEGVVNERLPLFVTLSCPDCGRGPWTVRLASVTSGLIDLPTLACASCGSPVPVTWPPKEHPVPKNHVGRGPTDSREADLSPDVDASEPQTVAEDGLGRPTSEERAEDKQSDDAGAAAEKQSEEPVVEEKQDDKPSYDGMSLAELRAEADKRQLPSHGNKSQLIERLREADAS